MSRRWQLAFFLVGAGLFTLLVRRIGPSEIVANATAVGWLFVPILGIYAVAYACNALAWRLTMTGEGPRPSFLQTYAITISYFALNFVTPVVNAGGEPFRIAAVTPWLGRRRAAGSAVIHRMLNALALLLTWLTALVLGLALLPHQLPIVLGILLAMAVVSLLVFLLVAGHRRGVLERTLNLLHRVPLLDRVARAIEHRRQTLTEMDLQIADFYHTSPRRFVQAVGLEYLARSLSMVEYYLICVGVGIAISYPKAYLVGGLLSLIQNALFVVPFELGVKEGGLYLLFQLVGLDASAGVYTAIVSRARDIFWIGAGLLLLAAAGRRLRPAASVNHAPSGSNP